MRQVGSLVLRGVNSSRAVRAGLFTLLCLGVVLGKPGCALAQGRLQTVRTHEGVTWSVPPELRSAADSQHAPSEASQLAYVLTDGAEVPLQLHVFRKPELVSEVLPAPSARLAQTFAAGIAKGLQVRSPLTVQAVTPGRYDPGRGAFSFSFLGRMSSLAHSLRVEPDVSLAWNALRRAGEDTELVRCYLNHLLRGAEAVSETQLRANVVETAERCGVSPADVEGYVQRMGVGWFGAYRLAFRAAAYFTRAGLVAVLVVAPASRTPDVDALFEQLWRSATVDVSARPKLAGRALWLELGFRTLGSLLVAATLSLALACGLRRLRRRFAVLGAGKRSWLKWVWPEQRGSASVEYALLIALVLLASAGALKLLGGSLTRSIRSGAERFEPVAQETGSDGARTVSQLATAAFGASSRSSPLNGVSPGSPAPSPAPSENAGATPTDSGGLETGEGGAPPKQSPWGRALAWATSKETWLAAGKGALDLAMDSIPIVGAARTLVNPEASTLEKALAVGGLVSTWFPPAAIAMKIAERSATAHRVLTAAARVKQRTDAVVGQVVQRASSAVDKANEKAKSLLPGRRRGREPKAEARCSGPTCLVPGKCFVAGTLVWTSSGLVPIERVHVGDLVIARDERTGEQAPREVTKLIVTENRQIVDLDIETESGGTETLGVTPGHPFWVKDRGWVPVGELWPGDEVYTSRGGWVRIKGGTWLARGQTTYNFEVAEFHTYFVGDAGAWVHNGGPEDCPGAAGGGSAAGETAVRAVDDIPATFIGQANGPSIVVPRGATGPVPTTNGLGVQYVGGSGGPGLSPRTSSVRIMEPTLRVGPSPGYPSGYASYSNAAGQAINPLTGQTVAKSSPWWHIDLGGN